MLKFKLGLKEELLKGLAEDSEQRENVQFEIDDTKMRIRYETAELNYRRIDMA